MTRLIVQLGAWSVFGLLAGLALTWHFAFRNPVWNPLPLPRNLISVGSAEGDAFLAESRFVADFPRLSRAFMPQARRTYSGVASAVTVLNALRDSESPITQSSFFIDPVRQIRSPLRVSFRGMTFVHLRDALRTHGVDAEAYYASDLDIDSFRSTARVNLATAGDFLIVNYSRTSLLQKGGAHIAPVAAYHAPTDRILVLDAEVAHYPPVWVTVESIWNAMKEVDDEAPRGRGFVVVREGRR